MREFVLVAALLSTCLPVSAEESWRLFVADHTDPKVTAVDLGSGTIAGTFGLAGPASLYTTPSRRAVYAVQGSAGQVAAIASGITLEDHGDHGDLAVTAPELLGAVITGDRPVHFVEHGGELAVFFDGEGRARLLRESDWLDGDAAVREVITAAPHHGVAAPFGGHVLLSRPHAGDPSKLPVGIDVQDAAGNPVGDLHSCPDLHGEASSGDTLAIACGTGLLLARETSSGPEIEFLPYGAGLPEGKATTLLGGTGMQYWLGNWGADKVAIIDPSNDPAFRIVDLPSRRVHFALDSQQVKFAYVLTEDGDLHRIDVLSASIDRTVQVTEPYSMDGEWHLPRPRLAVAGGSIAVTDPLRGVVHILDSQSLALTGDIAIDGKPFGVVAVGGSGESHAH